MDDGSLGMEMGSDAGAFPWQACLVQLSGGTVAGMAVGYALKAAIRMALMILGSVLLLLGLLAYAGFITVNWEVVGGSIETGTRVAENVVRDMISQISSSLVGFTAGLIGGWRLKR